MSKDATIGVPSAEATGGGVEPGDEDDDAVATIYTHNGEQWVPKRLEPGETTSIRTANGRPAAFVEIDADEDIADVLGSKVDEDLVDRLTDNDYGVTD